MPHDIILQLDVSHVHVHFAARALRSISKGITPILRLPPHNVCNGSGRFTGERWSSIVISHSRMVYFPSLHDDGSERYIELPCQSSTGSIPGHTFDFDTHQHAVDFSRFALAGLVADCKLRALSLAINAPSEHAQEELQ